MTLYALTTDGQTVTTTATLPPTGARRLDTGAWVTPPADGWTADLLAACGWLPVTEVPRPADTATHTSDPAPVALVAGVPTQQWTVRPWTAEELARQAESAARFDDLTARVAALEEWRVKLDAADPTTPDAPTWEQLQPPDWWLPGGPLTDAGKVWRNISGTVLTTPPSGFPGGGAAWVGRFFEVVTGTDPEPEPEAAPEWSANATYAVDARVTRGGIIYRCLVPHGPEYQGTWGPPLASVWTPA